VLFADGQWQERANRSVRLSAYVQRAAAVDHARNQRQHDQLLSRARHPVCCAPCTDAAISCRCCRSPRLSRS
jgi:hypothetical protein